MVNRRSAARRAALPFGGCVALPALLVACGTTSPDLGSTANGAENAGGSASEFGSGGTIGINVGGGRASGAAPSDVPDRRNVYDVPDASAGGAIPGAGGAAPGAGGSVVVVDGGTRVPVEPTTCNPVPAALLHVAGAGNGAVSGCPVRVCTGLTIPDFNTFEPLQPDISGFAGCTTITGSLDVAADTNPDLSELHCLEHVTGDVVIWKTQGLQTLHGLESLTEIDGSLQIGIYETVGEEINTLTRIDALTHLRAIGGDLNISPGEGFSSLAGLEALEVIGGDFQLQFAEGGHDLSGMNSLVAIGGSMTWFRPEGLQAVSGLHELSTITGDFAVFGATDLTELAGLPSLACIGGKIDFGDGDGQGLTNVTTKLGPFASLRHVVGDVSVYTNPSLTDLELFSTIDTVGGQIKITNNPSLTTFPTNALQHLGGAFAVTGNPLLPGCPLVSTVARLKNGGWLGSADLRGNLSACP